MGNKHRLISIVLVRVEVRVLGLTGMVPVSVITATEGTGSNKELDPALGIGPVVQTWPLHSISGTPESVKSFLVILRIPT